MSEIKWPPGPRGLPVVGSLISYLRDRTGFSLRMARRYGDAAHFTLGTQHVVQLNRPEFIHDVLVKQHDQFHKGPGLDSAEIIFGNGLVRNEGKSHRDQRKLLQPAFQQERLAQHCPFVVAAALAVSERWQSGQTVDMFKEMLDVTVTVAARMLFGDGVNATFEQVAGDLTAVFEYLDVLVGPLARPMSKLPTRRRSRFLGARQRLDDLIYSVLRARRDSGENGTDLLGMLLAARDLEGHAPGMSDRQLRDEAMTMFLAGHETTATALAWTWYLLAQHPSVESTLHAELDEVLDGRLPTFADVARLNYTKMVIAESMRLYPPIWLISRRALNDYAFGEWLVPAGTTIGMSQYVMHRDPRFYPEPERFDPLRWTEEEAAKRPKYSYFPFGGGPRLCIGERLAWTEAMLIIASLCQSWRGRLRPGVHARLQPFISLRPRGGLSMQLNCRRAELQRERATERRLAINA